MDHESSSKRMYTLEQIQVMLAHLENEITPSLEEEMKRHKLPVPEAYGGGFATGSTMEAAVNQLIEKVISTLEPEENPSAVSFEEYFKTWIDMKSKQEKSPVTIANYRGIARSHLIPFFKGKRMDEITPDDIQNYYNSIMHLSHSVSVQSKAILCGMFDRAARNELVRRNIMQFKYEASTKQGKKVVLQDEDLLDVIQALDSLKEKDIRDFLYVCFLCFTGLRREEILGLRWKDLDFEENTINVRNAVKFPNGQNDPIVGQPKDDSCGLVRLNVLLSQRIKPYCGKANSYVIFFSKEKREEPITRSMFSKMWRRINQCVNLKGATSHSFRASYATMVTAHCESVDAKVLQGILRHKTPDLAMKVYAKINRPKTSQAEYEYEMYLCNQLAKPLEQKKERGEKSETA